MTLHEALIKAFSGKEEPEAGAVADAWFTLGVSTHRMDTLLAAYFLQQHGIRIIVTPDVQEEHEWNYTLPPSHERYLDSEGVPKAPRSLESILQGTSTHLTVREFAQEDEKTLANAALTLTDKRVAREVRIVAQKSGACYLVTNDTALIKQIQGNVMEQGLNIVLLMPSTIESNLARLLPELGLQLLIPGQVLAQLYKLGSGKHQYADNPYVHVNRRQPYKFGSVTITIDIADGVFSTGKKTRRAPARTDDYGIPVAVVKNTSQEEVIKAVRALFPQLPKRPAKFALLPEARKYLPAFMELTSDAGQAKEFLSYRTLQWARIK